MAYSKKNVVQSFLRLSPFSYVFDISGLAFLALAMGAYVVMAIMGGPDLSWDIKNYHFYSGTVFLHGGFDHNLFPAQWQGWYNPLLDALTVSLIENLRPVLATAALAFLQSLNIPLIFILIRQVSKQGPTLSPAHAFILRCSALLISITGAMTLSELGGSFGDVMVSVPFFLSVVLLGHIFTNQNVATKKRVIGIALAGFCFGAAVGFKLTIILFFPFVLFGFLCVRAKPLQVILSLTGFGVASALGLLATDGFWLCHLWQMTGNPLFPFFNTLFHSPWLGGSQNLFDNRFWVHSPLAGLRFLRASALGQNPGSEIAYYDLRFVLIWLLLPVVLYQILRRQLKGWPLALIISFYASFVIWIIVFGIMRYAVPLEFLSGVVLLLVVERAVGKKMRLITLGVTAIMLCLTTHVPQWSPYIGWSFGKQDKNWFGIIVPDALKAPGQLFVMLSDEPFSYVIPFFGPDAQFVRMEGNLNPPLGTVLYDKRWRAIAGHTGPIFAIGPLMPTEGEDRLLANYGLFPLLKPCVPVTTNTEILYACPLERKN